MTDRNPDLHVVHAGFTPEQKAGSEAMLSLRAQWGFAGWVFPHLGPRASPELMGSLLIAYFQFSHPWLWYNVPFSS